MNLAKALAPNRWDAVPTAMLCLMLAGCTTWVKPGASPDALDLATSQCKAASYQQLPANLSTQVTNGATYADRKKCEKNEIGSCIKVHGRYTAQTSSTTDSNQEGRESIFRACMMSSGWREQ
jgi:hypothetical protein